MFRGKLLGFLKQSYRRGELCFAGKLSDLSTPRAFYSLLASLRRKGWVVYSKPPFGGPEHVLKYLARYTHRVAISNGRLFNLENGQIRFRWRDSRHNNRSNVMRLDAVEFIRRFLLHVLPTGFVKIRHFGLLANRKRRRALELCRAHLRFRTVDLPTLLNQQQRSALTPIMPQVPMRNPARRCPFLRWPAHRHAGCASPCHSRLFLKTTMLTLSSTRFGASAADEPAFAEVCVEPALPTATGPSSSTIRHGGRSQIVQRGRSSAEIRAGYIVSAPGKVHSIPIHPPR
jgi:hypothetical protein